MLFCLEQPSENEILLENGFLKVWIMHIIFQHTPRSTVGESVLFCSSLGEAVDKLKLKPFCDVIENIWIIGGASVYLVMVVHNFYAHQGISSFNPGIYGPPKLPPDLCYPSSRRF